MALRMGRLVAGLSLLLALASCGGSGVILLDDPAAPSSDATLSSLSLSQGELNPAFAPGTTFYFIGPSFFEGVATVKATTTSPGATMRYTPADSPTDFPLASGVSSDPFVFAESFGGVEIEVTAEDGVTRETYQVIVSVGAPNGLETYVKASNTGAGDWFGHAVATSGSTIVVGAPFESSSAVGVDGDQTNNGAPGSGAAYVFVLANGLWTQQAYLKASNTGGNDRFGSSVAISGDTIVVGAPQEDSTAVGVGGDPLNDGALSSGAAYVFVRTAGVWTQQAYLKAPNSEAGDSFGSAVSIAGDLVAIGAPGEDSNAAGIGGNQASNSASDAGAVHLFTRTGTVWSVGAYVKASNAEALDAFGTAVSLSGRRLAVGAPGEDSNATGVYGNQGNNAAPGSGATYLYARDDVGWFEEAYVKASNTGIGDQFGASVSLSSSFFPISSVGGFVELELITLVVGAPNEASNATGTDGDGTNDLAPGSGAAYVFTATNPFFFAIELQEDAYLKASNSQTGDRFGTSVASIFGTVVVGAPGESSDAGGIGGAQGNDNAVGSGAAYVFFQNGTISWGQDSYVKSSNARTGDAFGSTVALAGGTLVVGASREDSEATGINGSQSGVGAPDGGAVYILR